MLVFQSKLLKFSTEISKNSTKGVQCSVDEMSMVGLKFKINHGYMPKVQDVMTYDSF